MAWIRYKIKAFWRTAERAMSNKEKEHFNDWREDILLRLEALDIHAKGIGAYAEGTPHAERARKLSALAKETHNKFKGEVPIIIRQI